ncbi:hypothetical protein ND748_14755 [Frankia sp. AiPs1]|uniref:hypothetical protein n=1 Tax=Frankia sp. AiPs1 TaxID=573493 RepID=UPI002043C626|nr:hypothetical protein [Frankia sp. AiPs1]MCM3922916.1 hypothetical protein [Frankia sp. AiPs1]
MTGHWPAAIAAVVRHGPPPTLLTTLAITPGAHILLGATLERRRIRVADEYTALIYGDPLLALTAALGVALSPDGPPAAVRPVVTGTGLATLAGGWLLFGLAQWVEEVRTGHYTLAQATAPTKVWHQLGVYPLAGCLVCCAGLSGLAAPLGPRAAPRLAGKILILGCVTAWLALNVHDRRHPKLGHPPYDWFRLAPPAPPWPAASRTLRAHAGRQPAPARGRRPTVRSFTCSPSLRRAILWVRREAGGQSRQQEGP